MNTVHLSQIEAADRTAVEAYTKFDYKVDQGVTEGDAEACSLQASRGDRPSNDGIRSNRIWYY